MTKKKNKFELSHLIHKGLLKEGEKLLYVSNPIKSCLIAKQPNGEYKLKSGTEMLTIHQFAQNCLGQEPPVHASKWLRTENNKILYDLWHSLIEEKFAA